MTFPPGAGARSACFRSIFLSDVHLGSARSQAELLLDFLAHNRAEFLYLVGDIVDDGERPVQERWPATHRAVLEAMRRAAREGTSVCYVAGNHDVRARSWSWLHEELRVESELEHTTADGRRLWVVHGDRFDRMLSKRRWLSRLGDALARAVEHAGALLERLLGRRGSTLGLALKERCKRLLGYTARFERKALIAARSRSVDGIICGHVHSAASRTIDGLYYGNGGDWVGSASALVEHADGRLELLSWGPSPLL
jgi:UDP-2,3-diacylglucosamine pyrophosphatase LpxH